MKMGMAVEMLSGVAGKLLFEMVIFKMVGRFPVTFSKSFCKSSAARCTPGQSDWSIHMVAPWLAVEMEYWVDVKERHVGPPSARTPGRGASAAKRMDSDDHILSRATLRRPARRMQRFMKP